jgi:predicted 2-oxoglutarate/Fe(II)-dependent dioxygenase YbiX
MQMNLQDYVAIYNINNPSSCKQIIENIDSGNWYKHSYNDPVTNKNTTYEDDLEISYQNKKTQAYLKDVINKCVSDYLANVVPMPFKLQDLTDVRFNRYKTGTNMKFHHDHIHTLFDGEKKGVPIISVLGLLNDDFEGGDFLMFDGKKVNLSAGDIILFPSNFLYPHAVTTVTKGTRYSFVSWGW